MRAKVQHLERQNQNLNETKIVICILLFFVSFVPYRYLNATDIEAYGIPAYCVHFLPELTLILLALYRLREVLHWQIKPDLLIKMITFGGVFFLSGLGGAHVSASLMRMLYYFFIPMILVFLIRESFSQEGDFDHFVVVIVVISILVSIYALAEFIFERNWFFSEVFGRKNPQHFRFHRGDVQYTRRVYGTIGSPVYLGIYLVLCLPFAMVLSLRENKTFMRVLGNLGVIVGAGAILVTFSRGSWVSACLEIVVFALLRKIHKLKMLLLGILGGIALLTLGYVFWTELALDKWLFSEFQSYQTHGRTLAYYHATAIFLHNPLFGVGVGGYRGVAHQFGDMDHTPDNMYLRLIAETGIVGAVFLLFLFVKLMGSLYKNIIQNRDIHVTLEKQRLAMALFISLFGFGVNLVTCDALYFSTTRIFFWAFVGVALGFLKTIPKFQENRL